MKIKRDILSESAPAADQLEVGELAINAKTGILYSKLVDGTIIKWLGAPVCETDISTLCPVPVPEITFSDVSNFCCGGDSLTVYVSNLLVGHRYFCTISDLIEDSTATSSPAAPTLLPNNKSDRSATFNINIDKELQSLSMFKVSVYEIVTVNTTDTNMLRSEKLVNICCRNCTG
jgi:hypothetical protein